MKNKYFGHELRKGVETLAHKVCQHIGLAPVSIEWSAHVSTAGISQCGTMYLADIRDDAVVPASTFTRYCGYVIHELCHRRWTDFSVDSGIRYVRTLHNAVEDAWIEHNAINSGMTGNVRDLLSTLVEQIVQESLVAVQDWANPAQYPFALAVYLRNHAQTRVPLAQGLEPIFAQAADMLTTATSSKDTLAIAEWVYAQLKNLSQDNPQDNPDNGDPGEGQGGTQEGAQDASDGSESADQGQGKGKGTPDQENGSDVGQATAPADDCYPREVEPRADAPKGTQGTGCFDKSARIADDHYHLSHDANPLFDLPVPVSAKLQHEVRQLFESTDICEFTRNHKAGSINVHALPFTQTTDRVFKRRFEQDGIDSAVIILVDVSSSMFDDVGNRDAARAKNAVATCHALLDTLGRAGVATCVMAFDTYTSVIKPWSMSIAQGKRNVSRLKECGSTNDYFAVRVAHEMLYARPEARKVLFVLTDGEGHQDATRKQVQSGERLGVTTIGVGIQLKVGSVYANNVFVKESKDLGTASFKGIKLAA